MYLLLYSYSVQGQFVSVRVQSGTLYTGVFHGTNVTSNGIHFELRMAKDANDVLMVPEKQKIVRWDDFVELSAVHVETHLRNSEWVMRTLIHPKGAFQIDSEISGAELQERELIAWEDDTTQEVKDLLSGLAGDGGDWDQFEVSSFLRS